MGAVPTTQNQLASIVNDVLKGLIEGAGESAIVAAILADTAGVVAIPVIGPLYSWAISGLVSWLGKYFYVGAANVATEIIEEIRSTLYMLRAE